MSRFSLSLNDAPTPLAAIEITGGRVSAVAVEERGGRPVIVAHATEALPDSALVPTLNAQNVRDRAVVAAVVARVLERIGRPSRVGLIVGDPAVKVSLVRLQQVPSNPQDLDQVIRWQVRKTAPFAIEDAQVGYQAGLKADDGQDFVVTVARRDVIAEYESLCEAAGAHAGLVDLSTFNVVNTVLAAGPAPVGDWLLVNVAPGWELIAIMRGAHLVFFRNRGALMARAHSQIRCTRPRWTTKTDWAAQGLAACCRAARPVWATRRAVRRALAERLSVAVETVDPTKAASFADRIVADARLLDSVTPLVGLVLRSMEAA